MRKERRKTLSELREESAAKMRAYRAWQKTQPCKDKQASCRLDGGCLRHDTDQGEVCPND